MKIEIKLLNRVGNISLAKDTTSFGNHSISFIYTDTENRINKFQVSTADLLCAVEAIHSRQKMEK